MAPYAALAAVVFGVNLLPAFGPPTWAILVWFEIARDLDPVALVLIGATAATLGRVVLAIGARACRGRLPPAAAKGSTPLGRCSRAHAAGRLRDSGLFLLSPLPSAQLFVAAGLINAPLGPLAAAFFAGRLVSYSIYVGLGRAADARFGDVFESAFRSPYGIALQVAMLGALVLLMRIDWVGIVSRRAPSDHPATS